MNIRITRTAVTFCLVVAMTIQPMLAFGVGEQSLDANRIQPTLLCSGCGCCEIAHQDDKCCCCRGLEKTGSATPADAAADSVGSLNQAVGSINGEVHGACNCGVSTPPMNHNGQRNELIREHTLRVVSIKYVVAARIFPAALATVVDQSPGSRADFSQRMLCVWRI